MRFPSLPEYVCHFSYCKPQQVLTFHSIVEGPKELHSTHTKNLHTPQRFPNRRIRCEATKDQCNPLRGKKPVYPYECFGRRHIDPSDKRQIEHKELNRVVFPRWSLEEISDSFLDRCDCSEKEEA